MTDLPADLPPLLLAEDAERILGRALVARIRPIRYVTRTDLLRLAEQVRAGLPVGAEDVEGAA